MKKSVVILSMMLFIFGTVGMGSAELIDRGGGLIYDDILNITWLHDFNYAFTSNYTNDPYMDFFEARTWALRFEYTMQSMTLCGMIGGCLK